MDLTTYLNQQGHGAMSDFGRLIGAPPQTVRDWSIGRRPIPDNWCPVIEKATCGIVLCETSRADLPWLRVADAAWPHPNGRPVLDVARRLAIPPSSAGPAGTEPTPEVQTAQEGTP